MAETPPLAVPMVPDHPPADAAPGGRVPWAGGSALAHACVAAAAWLLAILHRAVLGVGGGVGDADAGESMVGVLANRLVADGPMAAWNWTGPGRQLLEALPASSVFATTGSDAAGLRLAPFFLHAFWTLASVALCGRWLGARAALAAALATGLTFPGLVDLQVRAWGGAASSLVLGWLALGAAAGVTLERPRRLSIVAGVLAGLAASAHPGMLPVTAACIVSVAAALVVVVSRPAMLLVALHHAGRMAGGLAVGLLPGWETSREAILNAALHFPTATTLADHLPREGGALSAWAWGAAAWVVLAAGGTAVIVSRRGADQPGTRLAVGALVALAAWGTLPTAEAPGESGGLATQWLVPMLVAPVLAAMAVTPRRAGRASLVLLALLWGHAGPSRLPAPSEDVAGDATPVIAWLDAHPGTRCFAETNLAWRVTWLSGERHACAALGVPAPLPETWAAVAAGPRAYFLDVTGPRSAAAFDVDAATAHVRTRRGVAGAYAVRTARGTMYPPRIPPLASEHARRDRRTLIDGDVATGVVAVAGTDVTLELVWPTPLASVSYWQDVAQLQQATCAARAGVVVEGGGTEWGPVVSLEPACMLARRWALWTNSTLEVRLPVPAAPAVRVVLAGQDSHGLLAPTEVRVTVRGMRAER